MAILTEFDGSVDDTTNFGTSASEIQSFKVAADSLITGFEFKGTKGVSSSGSTFTVNIRTGTYNGTIVMSETFNTSVLPAYTASPSFEVFTFSYSFRIPGGATQFFLEIVADNGHATDELRWSMDTSGSYADGNRWTGSGTNSTGYDHNFKVAGAAGSDTRIDDTFDRLDSNTVGGNWTEQIGGTDTERIDTDSLRLGNSTDSVAPGVSQDFASKTFPIQLSGHFNVIKDASTRSCFIYAHNNAAGTGTDYTGLGFEFRKGSSGNIDIVDGTTSEANGTFTINVGTDYYFWLYVAENGSNYDVDLYLSTTAIKPGAATLSVTNTAFTAGTGDATRVAVEGTTGGEWEFDFVKLEENFSAPSSSFRPKIIIF